MNLAFAPADLQALQRAMQYWVKHWDFECPTLFGIELEQLQKVLSQWPSVSEGTEETVALALLGTMRELLYGASAPRAELPTLIGLSYEQADNLCSQVLSVVRPVLGS